MWPTTPVPLWPSPLTLAEGPARNNTNGTPERLLDDDLPYGNPSACIELIKSGEKPRILLRRERWQRLREVTSIDPPNANLHQLPDANVYLLVHSPGRGARGASVNLRAFPP